MYYFDNFCYHKITKIINYWEEIIKDDDEISTDDNSVKKIKNYDIDFDNNEFEVHEEAVSYGEKNTDKIDYSKFNIFELYEYDIPMATISRLADLRISPYEIYLNGINSLDDVDISLNKKNSVIDAVNKMIKSNDINRTIVELNYQGITLSKCLEYKGNNLTVPFLLLSTDEQVLQYNIKSAMHERIKDAIKKNNLVIEESYNNNKTSIILENELKK